MSQQQELILVSAPNKAGVAFIKAIQKKGLPFAALTNNEKEKARMVNSGVKRIIMVDTAGQGSWVIPEFPIGKVFLFENSFNLSCRYIQICRSWTSKPIYVITSGDHPQLIYKGLGANYVIYSNEDDVSFLVN